MAFLRLKTSRGRPYVYLVENRWEAETGQSRQRVIAYLGRLDRIEIDRIPAKYRTAALVRSLKEKQAAGELGVRRERIRFREQLEGAMLKGDPVRGREVAREAIRELGPDAFLHQILTEAMHTVGRRWEDGTLSVSQEHLASSVAITLLSELNAPLRSKVRTGPEVVLCVPEGENHTIPLLLAERPLLEGGYRPLMIGPSAPSESIVEFVRLRRPIAVLISVTMATHLPSARALARRLHRELPELRLAIGGQGLGGPHDGEPAGVEQFTGSIIAYLSGWTRGAG